MMTRARRWRRLVEESSEVLEKCHSKPRGNLGAGGELASVSRRKTEALVPNPNEWRDWANLLPEIVEEICAWVLALDVVEYFRFRAVCRPWRELTPDPRARPLDSRFRPRNWMVVTTIPDRDTRRHLLNLTTAATLEVDLPALITHCHLCAADGLLVLFNGVTKLVLLLNPLTNTVTGFPPIANIIDDSIPPNRWERRPSLFRAPKCLGKFTPYLINGAGFDDSTSPPTLVLFLRMSASNIIFAKPGDAHWTVVGRGDAGYPPFDMQGRVLYHSFISLQGRCFVTSPEGTLYMLELRPLPRLVEIINQRHLCAPETHHLLHIQSFLVNGGNGSNDNRTRMLMVRCWKNVEHEHHGGMGASIYNQAELFTVEGVTGRMELLEVDIAARTLIPVRSLGRHAVFVGLTHCLLISTDRFPSIAADAIYMGCNIQRSVKFSMYHLKSKRTEPALNFRMLNTIVTSTCSRPDNLDRYLALYVDCKSGLSGFCINHGRHCF